MPRKKIHKPLNRRELNQSTYLIAPDYETIVRPYIYEFLKINNSKFELFFGVPRGTMKQVAFGACKLPTKYWHIVYEKLKPNYGTGIYYESPLRTKKKTIEKPKPVQNVAINNPLLERLKEQLSEPA